MLISGLMAEIRSEKIDKIKSVTIVSSRFGWGLFPDTGIEDEQRLTINDRGGVYFTAYGWEMRNITRQVYINIGSQKAKDILRLIHGFLTDSEDRCEATDVSRWFIHARTASGKSIKEDGPTTNSVEYDGIVIGDFIREVVPIDNLIVFGE